MEVVVHTAFNEVVLVPTINPFTLSYDGEWWASIVEIDTDIDGIKVKIKPGFVTNLGSVPKLARCLVDISDQSLLGYVVHDYLYSLGSIDCSRKFADDALLMLATICRQTKLERNLAYYGVRLFGKARFKKSQAIFINIDHHLIDKICFDNGYFPDPVTVLEIVNNRVRQKYAQINEKDATLCQKLKQ